MGGKQISLDILQAELADNIIKINNLNLSALELCWIDYVDTKNKTVSIHVNNTHIRVANVSYCYPLCGNGAGIISVPMPGSLGILVWIKGKPIILAYTAPVLNNANNITESDYIQVRNKKIPDLLEGEILIQSSGGSFIRLDKMGNLLLSSSIFALLNINADGSYELDIETGNTNINGILSEVFMENYEPIVKITKGRHFSDSIREKNSSVELCYSIEIIKDEKSKTIGIDFEGNIFLPGKIISYEV